DATLARGEGGDGPITLQSRLAGRVHVEDDKIAVVYEDRDERSYSVPAAARLRVETGDGVKAGDLLTDGAANPQDILRIMGREAVQLYLVDEVQKVYRSQGVTINDKHIEVIVRQMLRKVRIDTPGDTDLLPGELVDRFSYEEINAKVLAEVLSGESVEGIEGELDGEGGVATLTASDEIESDGLDFAEPVDAAGDESDQGEEQV